MKRFYYFVAFLPLSLCGAAQAGENAELQGEHQVKSALIYQIAKHTIWPDNGSKEFNICIYGERSLGNEIDKYKDRQIDGKFVHIRQGNIMIEQDQCKLLYIPKRHSQVFSKYKTALNDGQILAISDRGQFVDIGGMVGLREAEGKVVIELNMQALSQAKLKIEPDLIEAAIRVIR